MMRDWSIRNRLLFIALVPSLAVLVVLTALLTLLRVYEVERSLDEHGAALARHVARSAEFALFSRDLAELQRIAQTAQLEPDVARVRILDARAQEVALAGQADAGAAHRDFIEVVTGSTLGMSDLGGAGAPEVHAQLGSVDIVMSEARTEEAKRTQWRVALAIGLGGAALAILLALIVAENVVGPLRKILLALERITGGRLQERVDADVGGEMRTLVNGVNRMAGALLVSHQTLEERVRVATRELQAQKLEAEAANEAKSRFLAAASHDLRQPLHAIELFAGALQRTVRDREAQELSQKLEQAIASMDSLFNSLLDVYRLDAGVLRARVRRFPMQELLRSLDAEFASQATARGIRLSMPPTRLAAESDPVLLRRVIANLLSNALRHAPGGTVLVACRPDPGGVRIEVRDSGEGIDPADHQRIFQEFYRVNDREGDRGRGLGLSIVARIAELLGTRVDLRSQTGCGSTFSIVVTAARHVPEAPLPTDEVASMAQQARFAVLVVDDDPLVLQGTQAVTRDWGVHVLTATDLESARRRLLGLRAETILVMCDLWLQQQENGLEVMRALRTSWPGSFHGLIVTGDARAESLKMIEAAGWPILQKPVSAARLRAILMHYLNKSAVTRAAARTGPVPGGPEA